MTSRPLSRFELVLVGTMNPENLGAVARLMDNFGLSSLTLCAPRVARDDHRAMVVARTARAQLDGARVVDSVREAVAQDTFAVGLTARRGDDRPTLPLREAMARVALVPAPARVAFVFGPEDKGLSQEDADACDLLATIPTPGPLSSLNLGQAVALVVWELSQLGAAPPAERVRGEATREDVEGFLDHAFQTLDAFDYFRDKDRARKWTHLRRVLVHAGLTKDEVQGLRGLCRQALWVLDRALAGTWPPRSPD